MQILADEGPIYLADPQKSKVKKLFVNIKEGTLSYAAVLQSLDFSMYVPFPNFIKHDY